MVFVWSWNENGQTTETTNKQKQSDLIGLSNRYKHARVLVEPSAEKTSCPKIVLFPIRPCSFLHPYHYYKGYHCQGKAIDTKKVVFMIRRKVLFSSMIRFLFRWIKGHWKHFRILSIAHIQKISFITIGRIFSELLKSWSHRMWLAATYLNMRFNVGHII